ncbi:Uncharacterized protein PECH_008424 [Penicillium ucsense]|uniref:Uncharacterized protein n=1 Tax=Penicillium ucsense TaxID=2839758 RepID=A0A8J8VZL9_9EURO|nr:Uncharacterized protein PECM_008233 [Penicillium ucsense]KAF7734182.1 Uncharacterized protein PECH_008424 [Penicillium ucsense]
MASLLLAPFEPLTLQIKVLGVSRIFGSFQNLHGEDTKVISNTLFTEDLHYHAPSHQLFGTLTNWNEPESIGQGTIIVIDANTLTATRLTLRNFKGPFNTHGIDIYTPPEDPSSIYIVAVNHLPNPAFYASTTRPNPAQIPQARSRLQIFHHKLGSTEATHLRSIWHPLIRTPNDVYFHTLHEIYVTNDHFYRDGVMRLIEDLAYGKTAPTDLIHLKITDTLIQTLKSGGDVDDTAGVVGTVANKGIHNNNGLGHGKTPSEIMTCRTAIGQLLLAEVDQQRRPTLKIHQTIQLPCTLDNLSYFADPYVAKTGRDASGYVLAGLVQAIAFPNGLDPVMVMLVQPRGDTNSKDPWTQKIIFQDDGHILRTASTAVPVAIDPDANKGKKQANLFVTGPLGQGVVVSRINL